MTNGNHGSIMNVTPLIDILLVLMMIMMVITPIASRGLPAEVPETVKDPVSPPAEPAIALKIDRDSQLWLNGEPLPSAQLDQRLTQLLSRRSTPVLFIDGDPELPFAAVAGLVDRARGLGLSRAAILPPPSRN